MRLAEIIYEPRPSPFWRMLRQIGVEHAVALLPRSSRDWREEYDERPWDYGPLLRLKNMLEDNGLRLVAIEDNPPMTRLKLGLPGREEELDAVERLIENMGRLGVKVWIYNWMAGGWYRTHTHLPGPGGRYETAFVEDELKGAPPLRFRVEASQLWRSLKDFLEHVLPIAEQYDVRLALHPDDPPVPELLGVPRIMSSIEAFDRLLELVKSDYNGIAFCQGNFTLMTNDLPGAIRHFGKRIFFVHFRDVKGDRHNFRETLIGEGKTDLVEVVKAYIDVGYDGFARVDHTPTLEGDQEFIPGYSYMGRLYTIGYVKGLLDAVSRTYRPKA